MRDIAKPGAIKDRILIRLNYANVEIVGLDEKINVNP
jgi:hypothetical protein